MKTLTITFVAILSMGCSGPSSAGYDHLGFRTTALSEDGSPGESAYYCFTLPLLLGSRIEEEYPVGNSVELRVSADRDEVSFSSVGATEDIAASYEIAQLENGVSEDFELSTPEGDFIVSVQSGCFSEETTEP